MSRILPPGTKIPLLNIPTKFFSPIIQSDVECVITGLPWSGEKGYEVQGTIKVGLGETITIDAHAYKSGPTYRKLESAAKGYAATLDTDLQNRTGVSLAEVLVYSADTILRKYLEDNKIAYDEMDGPYMDFFWEDGFVSDYEDDV